MRKEDRRKEETGLHDPIKTCCRAIEMINKGERERERGRREETSRKPKGGYQSDDLLKTRN